MSKDSTGIRAGMIQGAWNAAGAILDDKGDLSEAPEAAQAKFLRRKCCDGLAEDVCKRAFLNALEIAQAAERFRRSSCPQNGPKPSRRYELLLSLARQLEVAFPQAGLLHIMIACRGLEHRWDR